jgi:hypothetical protein
MKSGFPTKLAMDGATCCTCGDGTPKELESTPWQACTSVKGEFGEQVAVELHMQHAVCTVGVELAVVSWHGSHNLHVHCLVVACKMCGGNTCGLERPKAEEEVGCNREVQGHQGWQGLRYQHGGGRGDMGVGQDEPNPCGKPNFLPYICEMWALCAKISLRLQAMESSAMACVHASMESGHCLITRLVLGR